MSLTRRIEQAGAQAGVDRHTAWQIADNFRRAILCDERIVSRTTRGPRKAWDGDPDLMPEGWVELHWERFEFHEEIIWIRPLRPGESQ